MARELLLLPLIIRLKIALIVVKKLKSPYQLELMFVRIVGMLKTEILTQQLISYRKD